MLLKFGSSPFEDSPKVFMACTSIEKMAISYNLNHSTHSIIDSGA